MLGRKSKAGKYLLKILLCRRITCELMLSDTFNKAFLSLSLGENNDRCITCFEPLLSL